MLAVVQAQTAIEDICCQISGFGNDVQRKPTITCVFFKLIPESEYLSPSSRALVRDASLPLMNADER
jgi:hypothetical protein